MNLRIEKDGLGELSIPDDKYWGIHTERALNNFNISGIRVPTRLIFALAMVKKACCQANNELGFLDEKKSKAILQACDDILSLSIPWENSFPLDALQGGAGTSTNMNLNEVIANRALELSGEKRGNYSAIHPLEDVNLHQSTNDVYPTALKIASIFGIREISKSCEELQGALQKKEKEFASILIPGRTEMQPAVPITLGAQFASFAEAIARDRWRTFKCEERLRTVNIGGTAVGTGMTAPRSYIFLVIEKLRSITGLGIARAEQVMDATANADVFVEVSGILNAMAVNLSKIASDLRLLHFVGEINLPPVQAGSSIMPGKINPVICESVISSSIKISANHGMISECASRGSLQINEFLPLIAFSLLETIEILINISKILSNHINGISVNEKICSEHTLKDEMLITAFLPVLGYSEAEKLIKDFHESLHDNLKEYLSDRIGVELVEKILSPLNLMALGYKK